MTLRYLIRFPSVSAPSQCVTKRLPPWLSSLYSGFLQSSMPGALFRAICTEHRRFPRAITSQRYVASDPFDVVSLEPNMTREGRYNGRPWTKSEDALLRDAVAELGEQSWVEVAARVGGGRTNRGCRQRWVNCICSAVNKGPFSGREIARVMELTHQFPKQWTHIAEELGSGRTASQVREIVMNRLNSALTTQQWTEPEDLRLRNAVRKHGVGRWSTVAAQLPGRSDAMCYERWTFVLAPELRSGAWSAAEDMALMAAVRALRASGKPFHFGHVADAMGNTRHRKSCRARFQRLSSRHNSRASERP